MSKVHLTTDLIPLKIYQKLRIECGLSPKTDQAATIGLKNSLYCVSLRLNNETIGMGRLVGDGGSFCQLVDICVLPEYQGKGYGKALMKDLIKYIKEQLPITCYISLIADGNASYLYEKYGFKDTLPDSKGMYLIVE